MTGEVLLDGGCQSGRQRSACCKRKDLFRGVVFEMGENKKTVKRAGRESRENGLREVQKVEKEGELCGEGYGVH